MEIEMVKPCLGADHRPITVWDSADCTFWNSLKAAAYSAESDVGKSSNETYQ